MRGIFPSLTPYLSSMDPSYEEMLRHTLPPAEAQIAINEERARLADRLRDPEHLRKELAGIFIKMRHNKAEWERRLKEVRQLGYFHKEDGTRQMVLKYSALELQALCGLATLASAPSAQIDYENTDNTNADANPAPAVTADASKRVLD
jgi:hypothetical protein